MGDACFPHNLGRRLLPDVCGYPVSRIVSLDVCLERVCFACRIFSVTCFSKRLGFSDTTDVKYRNAHLSHKIWFSYAYIRTAGSVSLLVHESFVPEDIISSPSNQCSIVDDGTSVLMSVIKY